MASLTALDDLEAAQVVHAHCKQKLDAAAQLLESVWDEVVQQVAQMEFVSSLADAVKARSTLALVEATLGLNSTGNVVTPLVQRLVFQASVLEEAWLVRQSIMEAVQEGKFDDIELWAEQGQTLGEDFHLELAYADRLRQVSQQTSKSSTSMGSWAESEGIKFETAKDLSKHSWDCTTAEPTPRTVELPPPVEPPAAPRRDPAPYSASGVDLKDAVWKAEHQGPPASRKLPESTRCFPASTSTPSATFPRFAEFEQRRGKERRNRPAEADWDYLEAKAQEQRAHTENFQSRRLPRPASAPARPREAGPNLPRGIPSATAQRTATRAKAQSLFGSWWKSWMGAASEPGMERPPQGGPEERGDREKPRAKAAAHGHRPQAKCHENFKGRLLAPKSESRESHLMILGFQRNAKPTSEELKKAYKVMAMRWHPDRPHNRDKGVEATNNFRTVKAAYDHLTRPSTSRSFL